MEASENKRTAEDNETTEYTDAVPAAIKNIKQPIPLSELSDVMDNCGSSDKR